MTLPLNRLNDFHSFEDTARFNMIEQQIRPWLVDDPKVLELLNTVKREAFVPEAFRALAFSDIDIPLLSDEDTQTFPDRVMLAPKIEARFLNDLKVQPEERVLEIGTGSGYMAALLAGLAKEVITLEIQPQLADAARKNLDRYGVRNVKVLHQDGSRDLPDGRFDVIVVSGAIPEIPESLLSRLNEGGRLIAIVGQEPVMQTNLVRRDSTGLHTTTNWDYKTAFLQGFPKPSQFKF